MRIRSKAAINFEPCWTSTIVCSLSLLPQKSGAEIRPFHSFCIEVMVAANLSSAFLAQSRVDRIYAAVITCSVLCTLAVMLRVICRRLVRARLWWDDWTILAALFVECMYFQSQILSFGEKIIRELYNIPNLSFDARHAV